jgi:hypothetical protein
MEVGSGTVGRVAAPEPSPAWRWVWSHGTRGSAGALPYREVGSTTMEHVAAPEPSSVERRGLEPWYTWQHVLLFALDS